MLTEAKQNAILDRLYYELTRNDGQGLSGGTNVERANLAVISGDEEAAFLWLAVNYLRGTLDPSRIVSYKRQSGNSSSEQLVCNEKLGWCRAMTYGVLEMGGASMQIAIELDDQQQTVSVARILNLSNFCYDY